ncbi:alpha/beta fold hydrolase [candidate division WOR-3 bacterium]|nr:alpha/beta fold hydrolase [candidate division WOR-3 bacterium]
MNNQSLNNRDVLHFKFPVGYEKFNRKQLYNFQLNRPYSFGYARFEDLKIVGSKIYSFNSWKNEMLSIAEKADREKRYMNSAFYYRAAEFYTKSWSPEKNVLYDKFSDSFYRAFKNDRIEKHQIPYENSFLSAIKINPFTESKGTIVIHGGFDSFIEEFYSMMRYFADSGYEVIGFDGPGQGATLRIHGIPITIEWEKPTGSVLDYFNKDNVTMIGLSMGGWLCMRAAAFEKRIKRVITSGHAIDYMKSMPSILRYIHVWCIEHWPDFMNRMAELKFKNRENTASWVVDHLMFITKKNRPMEALQLYLDLNERNISSDLVEQDVLILTSKNDHLVPFMLHGLQLKALVNAKSVTEKIFTEKDHAQNHCQIGNIGLALETMLDWLQ